MEQNQQPPITTTTTPNAEGGNTGIYILGSIAFVIALGLLYYFAGPRTNQIPAPTDKDKSDLDKPIPGNEGGAIAAGILTDPNFFNGIKNLTEMVAGLVKSGKNKTNDNANSGGGSPTFTGPWAPDYYNNQQQQQYGPQLPTNYAPGY